MTKETENENEKSIEELEAEYLEELNKKTSRIKAENDADLVKTAEAEKKTYEETLKVKWEEDYLIAHPPTTKIPIVKPVKLGKDMQGDEQKNYSDEFNRYTSGKGVFYEDFDTGKEFNYTDSDSGCEAIVTSWSPDDVYLNMVWHAMYCEANLFKIAVKGISVGKGDGLTVQIRTLGKFAAPTAVGACECISCVSATLGVESITIAQYGIMTEICELDIWDVGERYRSEYLWALGKRWGEFFDAAIYTLLEAAAAATSTDMAHTLTCTGYGINGSCCSDSSLIDFYAAVNDTVASMREGTTPYDPDYMIVSPSVAAILKRMQTPVVQAWAERILNIDGDGRLTRFNGLNVIEYCGANACSTVTDEVFAIIIDSRRAFGAAFGKRPTLESDRNIDCNSTTYAMWCYFGAAVLDVNAIAHIKSPNA